MKCFLVRLKDIRSSDVICFPAVESLALGYLASSLRDSGHKVEILDEEIQGIRRKNLIRKLKRNDGIIGFTAIAKPQIFPILEVIRELRESGSTPHITIGGQFATYLYKHILAENLFDSVIRYEGERTIVELAEALENNRELKKVDGMAFRKGKRIIVNRNRELIPNLDSLPFPARDTLPKLVERGGLPVISSSRGCYNRCSYCSISQFYSDPPGKIFRARSAENVLVELSEMKEKFGIKDVWFVDDNFVIPGPWGRERTEKLCRGISEMGLEFDIYLRANDVNPGLLKLLKRSGIMSIFIGAEAGCNDTLQGILNKNTTVQRTKRAIRMCNEFGINVDPGFIMFHPWSTMKEIGMNIRFLKDIEKYTLYGIASFLTAYSFTPIGREMLEGRRTYRKTNQKEAFPDAVPYEIMDRRAELLLCLTLKAFEGFKPIPHALSRLKEQVRLLAETSPEKSSQLEAEYSRRDEKSNRKGMHFFERMFSFLKTAKLDDETIRPFFEGISREIREFSDNERREINELIENLN
jgi:anaerobic magnesium-protoporphyrin IX monomethyl ester cyclase